MTDLSHTVAFSPFDVALRCRFDFLKEHRSYFKKANNPFDYLWVVQRRVAFNDAYLEVGDEAQRAGRHRREADLLIEFRYVVSNQSVPCVLKMSVRYRPKFLSVSLKVSPKFKPLFSTYKLDSSDIINVIRKKVLGCGLELHKFAMVHVGISDLQREKNQTRQGNPSSQRRNPLSDALVTVVAAKGVTPPQHAQSEDGQDNYRDDPAPFVHLISEIELHDCFPATGLPTIGEGRTALQWERV